MTPRRAPALLLAAVLALGLGSCGSEPPPGPSFGPDGARSSLSTKPTRGRARPRPGVRELDASAVPRAVESRTVYVPVHSHIYVLDTARPFNLAVTLVVRNTDRAEPLYVTAVRYHDSDGRLVRDYAPRPLRVAPLAAAEFFVGESDTAAGSSASFLVEWRTPRPITEPIVEAVMVGTSMNQGISFISFGRPVDEPARRDR